MIFPFYIKLTKKLAYPVKDHEALLRTFEKFVIEKKAKDIEFSDHSLIFKSGFFGMSWDYFAFIEKGVFTIGDNELVFEFFMLRDMLIALGLSSLLFFFHRNPFVVAFMITLLCGGNLLTGVFRYKSMLNRIARHIENLQKNNLGTM